MPSSCASEKILPPLWLIFTAFFAVLLWLAIELKEIVTLIVVGYSLAYVVDPLLTYMQSKKIGRMVSLFAILGVSLISVFILIATALPTLMTEYQDLSDRLPDYVAMAKEKTDPLLKKLEKSLPALNSTEESTSLWDRIPTVSNETVGGVLATLGAWLLKGYSLTLTIVNLLLLPFIFFYLALDFSNIHAWLLGWFPRRMQPKAREIALEINQYVSAFVRGQFIICFILFILYAIGLWMVGIKLPILIAFIAGFGNLVPYLGFIIGIALSTLMALVTYADLHHVFLVWAVFAVVQILEGFVVTPRVLGSTVGLSPLAIILAIVAGGSLFGLLGVFLAVPAASILKVLISHTHDWLLARE